MTIEQLQKQFFSRLTAPSAVFGLFEAIPDILFFIKDTRGRVIVASDSFVKRMGGGTLENLVGKTDFDYCPAELARRYEADDQQVMRTGKTLTNRIELNQNRDGSVDWVVTSKMPLYGKRGVAIGIAGVARCIKTADVLFKPYDRLAPALDFISREFNQHINVKELAKVTGMSLSQFERKFRKIFRMSPRQFIINTRINHACSKMADAGRSLTEIAVDVGFYDHSAFTKQFTRHMGMTPKAYRNKLLRTSE